MRKLVTVSGLITILFMFTALSFAANNSHFENDNEYTYPTDAIEKYQLIVLLYSNEHTPDKINQELKSKNSRIPEIFGNITKATYLIRERKKIGFANVFLGMTPEEIDKHKYVVPDLSLVHPDSVEARLQRYMVLQYKSIDELNKGVKIIESSHDVISINKNNKGSFSSIPNDPFFQNVNEYQRGMYDLNLPNVWDKVAGHAYIGIPDSGIDGDHPDLTNFKSQLSPRNDRSGEFLDPDSSPGSSGHGTHVAGIIAATTNNSTGVAGACQNCSLSVVKFNTPNAVRIASSYNYFSGSGIQIVNSSFGDGTANINNRITPCAIQSSTNSWHPTCDAIQLLLDRDVIISAASGNGSNQSSSTSAVGRSDFVQFPASDPRTIAVGALDVFGNRANYSDYGGELDVMAMGTGVLSTMPPGVNYAPTWQCGDTYNPPQSTNNDGYGLCTGTSMSAPHITGALGLIRTVDPLLNSSIIKENVLFSSAPNYPTKVSGFGYGEPDVNIAVQKVFGIIGGVTLTNRLTPLFSLYSYSGEDSFYTTVPQMAWAGIKGTMPPRRPPQQITPGCGSCGVETFFTTYLSAYGSTIPHYTSYPHEVDFGPFPTPVAEVYVFTTKYNPIFPTEELVPLYRLSYHASYLINNPFNSGTENRDPNMDHVYTTEQSGITVYENLGYKLDGIEGYVFSNQYAQPAGTEALHRRYNTARDDHAIFPESKLSSMIANGYTHIDGSNSIIGYVYLNEDSDNDDLIDGFERVIGTCLNNSDTDDDGILDGDEVLDYPRTDPMPTVVNCNSSAGPQYTWQDNTTGTIYPNFNWNYALGYHFTPQVDGTIDQLGGFFNGTKIVKLFNKTTGVLLAQTTVTANNSWAYGSISPVAVQAGMEYTVAVYLAGSGGAYQFLGTGFFPQTFDDITINGSTYAYTASNANARPTNTVTNVMYGQADIRFTPDMGEHTWQDNESGTLGTNVGWDYTMGYHFTPQVNGTIDQLGGYFNGTRMVKLYNTSTGILLGQTNVTANNNWSYNNISPVSVQAGVGYTVATYLAGSGASHRANLGFTFPQIFNNIEITGTTYIPGNARPTYSVSTAMYGQSDIRFIPD